MGAFRLAWHYTSAENWERIRSEGLVPYRIAKPELEAYFPGGLVGVWLWADDLSAEEHAGSVLWQLMTKASSSVVKLRVRCPEACPVQAARDAGGDRPRREARAVGLPPRGPAVLATGAIPPRDIELVGRYDLLERLR